MLVVRTEDCVALLTVENTMAALKEMLREQAAGKIVMPERMTVDGENGSFLRLMPAVHNGSAIMGFKCMNLTPGAGVHYWIALIDMNDGKMLAQLDADYITTLRTSATAAIATEMLAPKQIDVMAMLGTSTQADGFVQAMKAVREIGEIVVFSPNPAHRAAFAERVTAKTGIPTRAVDSTRDAVRAATLVCSAYRAGKTPEIFASDVRPGAHVNGLSSVRNFAREVDDSVWQAASRVVLDHRDGIADSGDGISVTKNKAFDLTKAPELFEALRDGVQRDPSDGVTLFKSVGAATQDIAVAHLAYRLARDAGRGQEVANFPEMRVHLS